MGAYGLFIAGEKNIFNNRRSEIDIMQEILTLTQNSARKTQILYQVNLSYTLLKNYLMFLISNDFIREVTVDNDHNPYSAYQLTEKGHLFMKDIKKVQSHLNGKFFW